MARYDPIPSNCWQGRVDGDTQEVLRWHQVVQCIDLANETLPVIMNEHQQGVCFIGFCSDEGVERNKGRIGAKSGPAAIRKACVNLPVIASHILMIDVGDVICDHKDLETAQQMLGAKIKRIRQANFLPVVIGGGHEVAYGNFLGLEPFEQKLEFGIINFDAHFDLRKIETSIGATSGTGIWQVSEFCKKKSMPFHYLSLGIQRYSNTRQLFEMADKMDAIYFLAEDLYETNAEQIIKVVNGIISNADMLQLSIDMDVFAAAYAPGVSATSYNGITPDNLFKRIIRHVVLSGKVATVDIAETNPLFDIDARTANLAASIIFDIIQAADVNAEF
ncbi:MAG: formimidoylglutamase [Bacteroidota bacterium]